MRSICRHALPISIVLASVSGCHSQPGGPAPTASASASASALPSASAAPPRRLKPMRRPGVTAFAFNAARELTLTDDQMDNLEKVEDQAAATDPESRAAAMQYQSDITASVQSGKFDSAKLKADYAAIDKASEAAQQSDAQALNALYAALDPQERTTLVANLRAREAAFDAHRPADNPDAGAARHKEMLDRVTQDLTLDPGQQKRVAQLIAKDDGTTGGANQAAREEMKKRLDGILDGFDKDGFDATKLDLEGTAKHEMQERETNYLSKLVPILTTTQREKLASERVHPMGGHGFGPGMRPMVNGPMTARPAAPAGPPAEAPKQ